MMQLRSRRAVCDAPPCAAGRRTRGYGERIVGAAVKAIAARRATPGPDGLSLDRRGPLRSRANEVRYPDRAGAGAAAPVSVWAATRALRGGLSRASVLNPPCFDTERPP